MGSDFQNMPYFIKPSLNFSKEEKTEAYETASSGIDASIKNGDHRIMKMATINSILKTYLPYYYWVGFYIVRNDRLEIGPYQGTMGCLYIDFDKGVCGKAAREVKTQIIEDVNLLSQGDQHIACDPHSHSEICVPVVNGSGELIAVFDVDSTNRSSFDQVDMHYLEGILNKHFQ